MESASIHCLEDRGKKRAGVGVEGCLQHIEKTWFNLRRFREEKVRASQVLVFFSGCKQYLKNWLTGGTDSNKKAGKKKPGPERCPALADSAGAMYRIISGRYEIPGSFAMEK